MGLAFQPESLDAMRDRWDAALAPVWDVRAMMEGQDRPGLNREHVFDFEDGNRFIVSRDRQLNGDVMLHVSVSFSKKCAERFPEEGRCRKLVILAQKRLAFLQGVSLRQLAEPSIGVLAAGVLKWWWLLERCSQGPPAPTKSDTK